MLILVRKVRNDDKMENFVVSNEFNGKNASFQMGQATEIDCLPSHYCFHVITGFARKQKKNAFFYCSFNFDTTIYI